MKKVFILTPLLIGSISFAQQELNDRIVEDLKTYKEKYAKFTESLEYATKKGIITPEEKKNIISNLEKEKLEEIATYIKYYNSYADTDYIEAEEDDYWNEFEKDSDTIYDETIEHYTIEDELENELEDKLKNYLKKENSDTTVAPIFSFGVGELNIGGSNIAGKTDTEKEFHNIRSINWEWGLMATSPLGNKKTFSLSYGLAVNYNVSHLPKGKDFLINTTDNKLIIYPNLQNASTKLRNTYITLPVLFNFNLSKIKENGFKISVGGHVGALVNSKRITKYSTNNLDTKRKDAGDWTANRFQYGVQAAVGYKNMSVVFKYDLNETFKNQERNMNLWTIGLRLGL